VLDGIDVSTHAGLRDRALIALTSAYLGRELAGVGFTAVRLGGSSKKPSPFSALVLSGEARHETSRSPLPTPLS
jgi:hypothetical protein